MTTLTIPEIGAEAPDLRLRGPGGVFYSLSEFRGEKNVLLVFYPLAFSPVCSHQLPEIQQALPRFEAADTVVFGISVDSYHANAAFARALRLDFPLLSDWKREASTAYGVLIPQAGIAGRAVFLVDKQGRIVWREVSEDSDSLEQVPSPERALAALESVSRG
jgi:peroxiredoxin